MTPETKQLIESLREYACMHYEEGGWDYVVEAFEDDDILDAIEEATDFETAKKRLGRLCSLLDERRRDIQSEAFLRESRRLIHKRYAPAQGPTFWVGLSAYESLVETILNEYEYSNVNQPDVIDVCDRRMT